MNEKNDPSSAIVDLAWTEIEISLLMPGLILAGDIYSGDHILLGKNSVITEGFIKALERRGIEKVRVTKITAERISNAAKEIAADKAETLEMPIISAGMLAALADELVRDEVSIWNDAGIETAVEGKLLGETQRCVEDVFARFKEGSLVKLDATRDYVEEVIKQALARPSAAVKLADVEHFDEYTFRHSVNVSLIFLALAREIFQGDELSDLTMGALLHDLGKMRIPARILQRPGRLTPEEFALVKKHAALGAKMLSEQGGFSAAAVDITLNHHERWDGSGYPRGLKEREISIPAQMAAVSDVYDALTTTRCYKEKMDFTSAMNIVIKSTGTHFSPRSVNMIWSTLGLYPIGSFVRLSTGEIAVIQRINPDSVTRPTVAILYGINMHRLSMPRQIDLRTEEDITIVQTFAPRSGLSRIASS